MTEREIFLAAIELLDRAARNAYLERVCAGDLRSRVEALLQSHESAGSFLITPVVQPPSPPQAETRAFNADSLGNDQGSAEDENDFLSLLAPSNRPGALGRIGHYDVLQVLGRGGFGVVFRAFDDVLQRVVAVKMMAPQMAATSPARKRFLREARTSAQVRHENVVQVYEVGEQPLPFLVMEFIPGETLQQRLDRTGPLDVGETLRTGRQIAEGLAAAHATDLIHRDIKPGNVLIEGGLQKVKITDFGLARAADDASISQSGIIAGTPMYMSPEQTTGQPIDQRADLFSLGSVLYQMVTGRPPFRANCTLAVLKRVAEDTPRPIREIIPETPPWLVDIIAKLHAKDPDDRFQSAREVADVLEKCETQFKASADPRGFPKVAVVSARSGGRKRVAAFGALVLAVAGGLIAYSVTRPDKNAPNSAPSRDVADKSPAKAGEAHDPAADRRAAVYVLSIGGGIRIDDAPETIVAVEQLPKGPFTLTGVMLRNNAKVTDEGLAFFRGCRGIKYLEMAVTKVTDAGLAYFKDCAEIRHLDLFSTNVSDAGLAHFKQCRGLTCLSLRSTRVTDAGAAWFGDCTGLTYLSFAHTQVTEAGLAYYRNCTKLEHIDLDVIPATDESIAPFANCKNLRVLHLGGTQVTDRGLAPFKQCSALQTLFLLGSKVTEAGIDEVKAALPHCRIEWNGGVIEPAPVPPLSDAEAQRIAALPVADQVEAVRDEFKKRNPAYAGEIKMKVEGDAVTELVLQAPGLRDLSPARALTRVRLLECSTGPTLENIAPLQGMRISHLSIRGSGVTDLSPLKGMQLDGLELSGSTKLTDLSPLQGMRLTGLHVAYTPVQDLSPLKGMKLVNLNCQASPIADLSPLEGMAITELNIRGTRVTNTALLKGLPLQKVEIDFDSERDAANLRSIATLVEINRTPVVEFWKSLYRPNSFPALLEADLKRIAALPPLEQVEEVRKELKKRNPEFDGPVTPTIEGDAVTGLEFLSNRVRDITPVRALTRLTTLTCRSEALIPGRLANLSPLKGMKLTSLTCSVSDISDLSPLKGMPLTLLHIDNSPVADLTPLEGMSLKVLNCSYTKVSSLAPLKGMSPTIIWCNNTEIADLSPLRGMRLEWVTVHATKVTDLSPLRGMPLTQIYLDFDAKRDGALLRSIKTLQKINDKPAEEFLTDAGVPAGFPPLTDDEVKRIAALPAAEQIEEVRKELKKRNPDFDGKLTERIEGSVVKELAFKTDNVADIAPVRALTELESLDCECATGRGILTDLSPLRGLKLRSLNITGNQLADLSPLSELPLASLVCRTTQVVDLTPLKDLKLTTLECGCTHVTDLSPLKGMNLSRLVLDHSRIADLSPLKGMALKHLRLSGSLLITDLSPLKGMKLTHLYCNDTRVVDLSPLADMPLKDLACDFNRTRDAEVLRAIQTLETINSKKAADFWKEVD